MDSRAITKLQLLRWADMHQIPVRMGKDFQPWVSVAAKGIPTQEDAKRWIRELRWNLIFQDITKITVHHSGDITVHTPNGNCRFWRTSPDVKARRLSGNAIQSQTHQQGETHG